MADNTVSGTESGSAVGVSVVESDDPAQHAGGFDGWDLQIDQVSAGRFSGRIVSIRLGGVDVIRETTTQALIKQGAARPDSLVFSLPLAASGDGHFNGRVLNFPNILLSDGADLPTLLTGTQLDVVSIVVSRDGLSKMLEARGQSRAADFIAGYRRQHHRFQPGPGGLLPLQQDFRQICSLGKQLVFVVGHVRARASLENAVVDALADLVSKDHWTEVNDATVQKKIVDRLTDYVFAHVDQPPDISDLCRHVGLSRRTLQGCFRDALGLAPSQYLRMLRLNAVRRELRELAARGQPVSIGDVAARWGFWHWSRFSESYRSLFGELPSQTIQSVLSGTR